MTFSRSRVCSFSGKNKLKSEIFNKKSFNITGIHRKIQFSRGGGGFQEKPIYRGDCLKRGGLGEFADLRGELGKKEGVLFLRGG